MIELSFGLDNPFSDRYDMIYQLDKCIWKNRRLSIDVKIDTTIDTTIISASLNILGDRRNGSSFSVGLLGYVISVLCYREAEDD